jgi:dTDP-4-dehydrorhamnose 3,5-epimerase
LRQGSYARAALGRLKMDGASDIVGVVIQPLKQMVDERGAVLHMLRGDSPLFTQFGEIYFSLILPGVVKAWKRHRRMTQHFAVPVGQIQLVLYDDRPTSASRGRLEEYTLGRPDHYVLILIPPLVWYGFQGIADQASLVANCTDLVHDPAEVENLPASSPVFPYTWKETHVQ